ncbi:MAG: spermidine/putrescine ABC transporter ATP-binding protein [Gammaproteobacteria bacterium]|nr:MAG: spermidine/putrescine ABC transporter ATP-binding protein [Gammaproteobacteria bacterium]
MNQTQVEEPFVSFREVQKSYDGQSLIVKNLNLDIAPGEFLTMLGPSGSGKSTCLMMLAGFEPATHGTIILDGQSINNVAPHKRNIGMVFQNYALFPHMSVRENLLFPLQVRKIRPDEAEKKVKRALDMVQMADFANRLPAQLSGGQQQRAAVARALVFDPTLVLMDEPLGALDKQLREQMQYEIKQIHETLGVTVVYVTHDQSEALTMSDRIAVFNDGVIQQCASPADLYEQPDNAFVAQFIGENNRLMGTVKQIDGDYCDVEISDQRLVRSLKVNVENVGDDVTLSLRPERVLIKPDPGQCPNIFDAQVDELIYLGDHVRTRLHMGSENDFIVKIANSSHHARLTPGQTVKIGWMAEDCRALDA